MQLFLQTGLFHWSRDLQGIMLSAFSYGYAGMMPFGGFLASRFGAHRVLFTGALIASLCTTLSPVAALLNPYLLVTVEAFRGLATVRNWIIICRNISIIHNWWSVFAGQNITTSNDPSFRCPIIYMYNIHNAILFTDTSTILGITKFIL